MKIVMTMLAVAALAAGPSFVSADGEGDGQSRAERRGRGKGHGKHGEKDGAPSRDAKFRAWDRDGDGSISPAEYPGHPGNFRALDSDNDGRLTFEEFQHRAGAGAPEGSRGDDTPAGRDEDFRRLDADGSISRGEWRGRASAFSALDGDGNGAVSREEYRRGQSRSRR